MLADLYQLTGKTIAQFLIALIAVSAGKTFAQASDTISESEFIYTPETMVSFDLPTYLSESHPDLLPYSEVFSHWSGRSSVSPKILIALIQHTAGQSGAAGKHEHRSDQALSALSNSSSLATRIEDVSMRLAETYYQNSDKARPELLALKSVLAADTSQRSAEKNNQSAAVDEFSYTFFSLFPKANAPLNEPNVRAKTVPPIGLLQLPYPIGEAWQTWGGTHSFTGRNSGPRSSLDFRKTRAGWGSDTSNTWVVSANSGTVIRHSSCFVEVVGAGGWSTTYYHLDNVRVSTNQTVGANTRIANYANNEAQSLCGGGQSNGPHVHFSLKRNGAYSTLDRVNLSGYVVIDGRTDYDSNCNFFWLDDRGRKICEGRPALNRRAETPEIPAVDQADLIIESVVSNEQNVTVEDPVGVSVSILNQGPGDAVASEVRVLLSTDQRITLADQPLASFEIEALESQQSLSSEVALLSPDEAGTYWLGACVLVVANEANVTNNCSVPLELVVEDKPIPLAPTILLLLKDDEED